jgi:large subunit ribosomal protein L22
MDKTKVTAIGRSLPISTKQSVEICGFLRGKTSERGKKILEQVIEMKVAVPYKKFMHGVGHKPGKIAAGRYPIKASSHILTVLKSAESNAEQKGLSSPYIIKEILANQASRSWHFGRHRRRKTKRTHVEITLQEIKEKKSTKEKTETKPQKEINPKTKPPEIAKK